MTRHRQRPFHSITAVVLAGLVLLLNAMAAAPALHEWFHPDAGQADHQCVVTLFAHGQVDAATTHVAAAAPAGVIQIFPIVEFSSYQPVIGHLPTGRGPPALRFVS